MKLKLFSIDYLVIIYCTKEIKALEEDKLSVSKEVKKC